MIIVNDPLALAAPAAASHDETAGDSRFEESGRGVARRFAVSDGALEPLDFELEHGNALGEFRGRKVVDRLADRVDRRLGGPGRRKPRRRTRPSTRSSSSRLARLARGMLIIGRFADRRPIGDGTGKPWVCLRRGVAPDATAGRRSTRAGGGASLLVTIDADALTLDGPRLHARGGVSRGRERRSGRATKQFAGRGLSALPRQKTRAAHVRRQAEAGPFIALR